MAFAISSREFLRVKIWTRLREVLFLNRSTCTSGQGTKHVAGAARRREPDLTCGKIHDHACHVGSMPARPHACAATRRNSALIACLACRSRLRKKAGTSFAGPKDPRSRLPGRVNACKTARLRVQLHEHPYLSTLRTRGPSACLGGGEYPAAAGLGGMKLQSAESPPGVSGPPRPSVSALRAAPRRAGPNSPFGLRTSCCAETCRAPLRGGCTHPGLRPPLQGGDCYSCLPLGEVPLSGGVAEGRGGLCSV